MTPQKRRVLCALASCLWLAAMPAAQASSDYPSKPITVVVGYSAGGPVDTFMRALGQRLSEEWKQQIIVENKPGANEAIAAQTVAKAAADGYTLFISSEGPLTQNQFLYSKLAYSPERDFLPVSRLVTVPMALVVPTSLPVNTLQEFLSLAKKRSATKPLNYGSAGMGGVTHLPMAMLAKQHGLEMSHVPYKGAAPLLPDLVSGQVDAAFLAVSAVAPFVRDGKLKALVVSAPARAKALPQTPVFSETNVADVQADFLMGLTAPAGTPAAVADKIASAVQKIMAEAKFREKFVEPFAYLPIASTPADFTRYLAKDRSVQAERIRVSGAQLD